MKRVVSIFIGAGALTFLGACSSVKIPDIDFFKLPEHKEARKDAAYPEVANAPTTPTDTRSDAAWDTAAKSLINQRDSFKAPEGGQPDRSPEEVKREFDTLKAQVNEYKKDDPQ